MTDDEIKDYLMSNAWTYPMKLKLVEIWNVRRKDVPAISIMNLKSPCQTRNAVSSFRKFISRELVT